MKRATYERRIEKLQAELEEMTRFNETGREMHRKSAQEASFWKQRAAALECTVMSLSRLMSEQRALFQRDVDWSNVEKRP